MKTLYLHIGQPKAGSSAIQSFCKINSERFKEKGFCYPLMPFKYRDISPNRNAHFLMGVAHDPDEEVDIEEKNRIYEKGLKILFRHFGEYDNLVLSDEGLWLRYKGDKCQHLFNLKNRLFQRGIQLKVIVYLRKQDEWLYSWWRQKIRTGACMPVWERFLEQIPDYLVLDYWEYLENMEQMIGKDCLVVRRYDKNAFFGGSMYADFLQCLGLGNLAEFELPEAYVNRSMGSNYAEIKRILNVLQPEDAPKRSEESVYYEKLAITCSRLNTEQYESDFFTAEERACFMQQYEAGNQQIATKYMHEDALFSQKVANLPKWTIDNPLQYENTILFFGQALWEQKQAMEKMQGKLDALQKELVEVRRMEKNLTWQVSPYCKLINFFRRIKYKISGKEMPPTF